MTDDLNTDYQSMLSDTERENEAPEWGNSLIGDATDLEQ